MNYELAKQLKDMGFPNQFSSALRTKDKGGWGYGKDSAQDGVYYPTLSELIEACGEQFYALHNMTIGWTAETLWDGARIKVTGETPEEAVAKLWLALKKA